MGMNEARAKVFKALGHPSRLMIVDELAQGTRCVCELTALVGADISTVSKHLTVLKSAGIVRDERRGSNVYYTLSMTCVSGFMGCVDRHLRSQATAQVADFEVIAAEMK